MKQVKVWLGSFPRRAGQAVGRNMQRFALFLFTFFLLCAGGAAQAQTDISSVITALGAYQTAALVIGVAVMLWTVGRMLVHKFTRG